MAKIYQFPDSKKQGRGSGASNPHTANKQMMGELIELLIITYEQRIEALTSYKQEIAKQNGASLKGPREVMKKVKTLQKLFITYGISCNFFKFYTLNEMDVIYYNETSLIYIAKREDGREGMTYTMGEFIAQYEGYPFTLHLDQALFDVFDKQISDLRITIQTLENTQV